MVKLYVKCGKQEEALRGILVNLIAFRICKMGKKIPKLKWI
jgi:hypothetical protein